jgi:hypothetical protein
MSGKSPAKYIDRLKDIQFELKDKYNYVRDEEDIIDQVVKVLGNSYPHIKNDICTRRLAFKPVTLEFIRAQFVEQFNNLKLYDSQRRGGKKEVKLGTDGLETTEEEEEKGMAGDIQ